MYISKGPTYFLFLPFVCSVTVLSNKFKSTNEILQQSRRVNCLLTMQWKNALQAKKGFLIKSDASVNTSPSQATGPNWNYQDHGHHACLRFQQEEKISCFVWF